MWLLRQNPWKACTFLGKIILIGNDKPNCMRYKPRRWRVLLTSRVCSELKLMVILHRSSMLEVTYWDEGLMVILHRSSMLEVSYWDEGLIRSAQEINVRSNLLHSEIMLWMSWPSLRVCFVTGWGWLGCTFKNECYLQKITDHFRGSPKASDEDTWRVGDLPASASRIPDRGHFLFPDADADASMIGLALKVITTLNIFKHFI